jgi:hypothetical protein
LFSLPHMPDKPPSPPDNTLAAGASAPRARRPAASLDFHAPEFT